ncbi:hypothetical protein BPTFM16_01236 [Altererythrobacter insulae]|nr:hypothetical protein BPTFM16_01236 [Altererythrobacter insulae]
MLDHSQPLVRTDNQNGRLTFWMIIAALILLVIGNNDVTDGVQIVGTDVKGAFLSIGVALLIAAITQHYTDFRVRSAFYKDIADSIVANQTLVNSGILKFYRDSKTCLPEKLLRHARTLDVGMVYSDRFLKDHIGTFEARGGDLKIRIFSPDPSDDATIQNIAHNTGRSAGDVRREFGKLDDVVSTLEAGGVIIERLYQKTFPHYSFYVIDNTNYFLTMSTFASRRATVPLFQVEQSSPLASLINADIEKVRSGPAIREGERS